MFENILGLPEKLCPIPHELNDRLLCKYFNFFIGAATDSFMHWLKHMGVFKVDCEQFALLFKSFGSACVQFEVIC